MPQNRIPLKSYHYRPQEGEQLEDQRNDGESSCNCGDGMDQRVQSLMFMMMMTLRYNKGPETLCILITLCSFLR